jgi:hypothetical protein
MYFIAGFIPDVGDFKIPRTGTKPVHQFHQWPLPLTPAYKIDILVMDYIGKEGGVYASKDYFGLREIFLYLF